MMALKLDNEPLLALFIFLLCKGKDKGMKRFLVPLTAAREVDI